MKYTGIAGLMVGLALLASCRQSKSTDDPEILKKVLLSYFDGIKNKDFKKMKDATTNDFLLYEMGRVWNNDSVFREMNRFQYTVEYKLDSFKIFVDNISGDMTYYNHGDFVFDDTTTQRFDWIESASFRKSEGRWKMNFLHITERK
jgi:hypothetical protein